MNFVKSGFALFLVVGSLGLVSQKPATALACSPMPTTTTADGNPTPPVIVPLCKKPKPSDPIGPLPKVPQPIPTPEK